MKLMGKTDNRDTRLVSPNPMKGSRNHLRPFSRQISSRGGTYEPEHLSEAKAAETTQPSLKGDPSWILMPGITADNI